MAVDRVMSQINDHSKIDVLRSRHDENMVEAVVIAVVDDINEAVVDGMAPLTVAMSASIISVGAFGWRAGPATIPVPSRPALSGSDRRVWLSSRFKRPRIRGLKHIVSV